MAAGAASAAFALAGYTGSKKLAVAAGTFAFIATAMSNTPLTSCGYVVGRHVAGGLVTATLGFSGIGFGLATVGFAATAIKLFSSRDKYTDAHASIDKLTSAIQEKLAEEFEKKYIQMIVELFKKECMPGEGQPHIDLIIIYTNSSSVDEISTDLLNNAAEDLTILPRKSFSEILKGLFKKPQEIKHVKNQFNAKTNDDEVIDQYNQKIGNLIKTTTKYRKFKDLEGFKKHVFDLVISQYLDFKIKYIN